MSNFTFNGSTSVVNADMVYLVIKIQNNNENLKVGKDQSLRILVNEVENVISNDAKVMFYNSNTQKEIKFKKKGHSYSYKHKRGAVNFEIHVTGHKNINFDSSSDLGISIFNSDEEIERILFNVQFDENFAIEYFQSNNSTISVGETIQLDYEIKAPTHYSFNLIHEGHIILSRSADGTIEDTTTGSGVKEVAIGSKNNFLISFEDNKPANLYYFTLELVSGTKRVVKKEAIIYRSKSDILICQRPENNNQKIINFCSSQDGEYLFALTKNLKNRKYQIWFTTRLGGRDFWHEVSGDDVGSELGAFAYSPMTHLLSAEEKADEGHLGRILLIGGSRIDNSDKSIFDKVATIELRLDNDYSVKINRLSCDDAKLKSKLPRCGHTCAIFPTPNNANTIWMTAGEDAKGNSLNDIWISENGIKWSSMGGASWSPRTMAATTVQLDRDNVGKCMWIVGGFDERGGDFVPEIFMYPDPKNPLRWKRVLSDSKILQSIDINSCSIGFGGCESRGSEGIYLLLIKKSGESNIYKVTNNEKYELVSDENKISITSYNQGASISAFFNGCWWFMNCDDLGDAGVEVSELFVRIPNKVESTIDRSSKTFK